MKKLLAVVSVAALFPMTAMAAGENNIGNCGWGSKLFDGQSGEWLAHISEAARISSDAMKRRTG